MALLTVQHPIEDFSDKSLQQVRNIPMSFVTLNWESTISTKEYQQMGLTRGGHKELEQYMLSKEHRKRTFVDTFYHKSAMLENEWNFERQDIDTNEKVSIIKTVNAAMHDKHPLSFKKTEEVVSYKVQHLECDFGSYIIEMDQVTFPKGDPHFTCIINDKKEGVELSSFTDYSGISIRSKNSVRSKLAEYFYRHERIL